MMLDTDFNQPATVLANIHSNFIECARKFYAYVKCLAVMKKGPSTALMGSTFTFIFNFTTFARRPY
jgi:hypothetical protein